MSTSTVIRFEFRNTQQTRNRPQNMLNDISSVIPLLVHSALGMLAGMIWTGLRQNETTYGVSKSQPSLVSSTAGAFPFWMLYLFRKVRGRLMNISRCPVTGLSAKPRVHIADICAGGRRKRDEQEIDDGRAVIMVIELLGRASISRQLFGMLTKARVNFELRIFIPTCKVYSDSFPFYFVGGKSCFAARSRYTGNNCSGALPLFGCVLSVIQTWSLSEHRAHHPHGAAMPEKAEEFLEKERHLWIHVEVA
ncbi:hypothetical protein ARMGADRAFT_1104806 [Armillaria gallica]|uniref:Uncharacterized protein n=1 Tax=Armillaria gallica TaxID=47427 RepID=A0A2H3DXG8_ARMGA|nr:hypothetical protein ARMGADRAFT_1104806 [Armillaria gallica]